MTLKMEAVGFAANGARVFMGKAGTVFTGNSQIPQKLTAGL